MTKHAAGVGEVDEHVPDGLTEQDLILGKRLVRFVFVLTLVATVAILAMAVYTYLNVPLDTRMPYDGRRGRSGRGIPMPIAVMISFTVPFLCWQTLRKRNAHKVGKGTRGTVYVVASLMLATAVFGQWAITQAIFAEAGVLPG